MFAIYPCDCSMVHDWIFFGRCRDNYGEFMLQTNHEFICRRGSKSVFIVWFSLVTSVRFCEILSPLF